MRLDKLTTAFQQALADGQSLAVARDNPYIEPAHLLAVMLSQPDGPKALLDRAGANTAALRTAMDTAIDALPQLLPADPTTRRDLSDQLQAIVAATGKLKPEGQRRLRRVLDLLAANTDQAPASRSERQFAAE